MRLYSQPTSSAHAQQPIYRHYTVVPDVLLVPTCMQYGPSTCGGGAICLQGSKVVHNDVAMYQANAVTEVGK
jgi:hypothetical protein